MDPQTIRLLMMLGLAIGLLGALRVAAGKLATRATIAPLAFLVSRTPVLVAWGLGSVGFFWLITSEAAANGKDLSGQMPLMVGLCIFCGLGVAALVVGPLWAISRVSAEVAELHFDDGDEVLYQTAANHFLNGEARGGKVFVSRDHIAFRPHRFNVQLETRMVPLSKVTDVRAEGSRFMVLDAPDASHQEWLVVMNAPKLAGYVASLKSVDVAQRVQRNAQLLAAAQVAPAN